MNIYLQSTVKMCTILRVHDLQLFPELSRDFRLVLPSNFVKMTFRSRMFIHRPILAGGCSQNKCETQTKSADNKALFFL